MTYFQLDKLSYKDQGKNFLSILATYFVIRTLVSKTKHYSMADDTPFRSSSSPPPSWESIVQELKRSRFAAASTNSSQETVAQTFRYYMMSTEKLLSFFRRGIDRQ